MIELNTNYYRPTKEQLEKIKPYQNENKLSVQRYQEAEQFINEISKMGFFERMFRVKDLCLRFYINQINKYNF